MSAKEAAEELKAKLYEENVKLCRSVQWQRCVYDRKNPCEKKECCERAWDTIANECNDTVKSCKERWRNIRFAFIRSLQSQANKRSSVRTREYYLYEDLIFLIPHISLTADTNRTTDSEDDDTQYDGVKKTDKSKLESQKKKSPNVANGDEELTTSADETATDEQKTPPTSSRTKLRKTSNQEKVSRGIKTTKEDTEKELESKDSAATKNDDPDKRDFRFRRACKRSLDKNVVQQLRNISPRQDNDAKKARRNTISRRPLLKNDNLKTETKLNAKLAEILNAKSPKQTQVFLSQNVERATSKLSQPTQTSNTLQSPEFTENLRFDYDLPESLDSVKSTKSATTAIEPLVAITHDQAVQCDTLTDIWDDEFLNAMRSQMTAMNSRQKMHFKQKVYLSLMEVFDNAANFPASGEKIGIKPMPPPLDNAVTTAEMLLIRELVSMVQAAKSTPELIAQPDKPTIEAPTAISLDDTPPKQTIESALAHAGASPPTFRLNDASRPHVMRKFYKSNPDGTFSSQDAMKSRIYRIMPKPFGGSGSSILQKSPNSSVGTFIIPRAPTSTASSVTASNGNENNRLPQARIFREIPVSGGGTMLVSDGQDAAAAGRRLMTIRSATVRPTSTCAPRQIVRRYSICGTADTVGGAKKIIATPLQLNKQKETVRATSATPPFKVPNSQPSTPLQSPKNPTTAIAVPITSASKSKAPFTLSTSPVKIPLGAMAAIHNYAFKNSITSSGIANISASAKQITLNTNNKKQDKETERSSQGKSDTHPKDIPNFSVEDTAGIIASDNFSTLNIKNEPMD